LLDVKMCLFSDLLKTCVTCSLSSMPLFFFSSRRRHTRFSRDWSSDVCSSDLSGDFPKSVHRPDCGIDAVPRLSPQNAYAPARQYARLQDDHHKHQMAKYHQYQSSCYRPDVFYAVRAGALPAFSSVLPAIRLFSALRAALGLDASRVIRDQTSLWAVYAPDLAVHPDQRSRSHQNSLSWHDRTCRNSARL